MAGIKLSRGVFINFLWYATAFLIYFDISFDFEIKRKKQTKKTRYYFGAESVRFPNFRELPWYLSNTYQMWPVLLKFIGEQDSGKMSRQGYHMLPWQPHFWRHVYSNFDFLNIFLHQLTKYLKQGLIISLKAN